MWDKTERHIDFTKVEKCGNNRNCESHGGVDCHNLVLGILSWMLAGILIATFLITIGALLVAE